MKNGGITAQDANLSNTQKENIFNNLLVLFQSLDEDGDPSNGINILNTTADAFKGANVSMDLKDDPVGFSLNTTFTQAIPEQRKPVALADAKDHFKEVEQELKNIKLKSLAGVYYDKEDNELYTVIRIKDDGTYLIGEFDGKNGIERGTITDWNLLSGAITAKDDGLRTFPNNDLNLGLIGKTHLSITSKDKITITDEKDVYKFNRIEQGKGNSILGTWAVNTKPVAYDSANNSYTRTPLKDPENLLTTQQFIFLADNTYIMLDPVGDDESKVPGNPPPSCGDTGVEAGKYNYTNGTITFSAKIADTNGCGGVHNETNNSFDELTNVVINCNLMTWGAGTKDAFTLKRINGNEDCITTDKVSFEELAGIYIPIPADIAKYGYVTVFRINSDGGYILGDFGEPKSNHKGAGLERGKLKYEEASNTFSYDFDNLRTLPENDKGLGLQTASNIKLISKNQISITTIDGTFTFDRFEQGADIVGTWATTYKISTKPEQSLDTQQFIFLADGTYLMLDPVGDDQNNPCGGAGIEAGKYTTKAGKILLSNNIVDTNGCAGIHDSGYDDIPFTVNGDTMTWTIDGEAEFTLKRIQTLIN